MYRFGLDFVAVYDVNVTIGLNFVPLSLQAHPHICLSLYPDLDQILTQRPTASASYGTKFG